MTENFIDKMTWAPQDWAIYRSNLDILRHKYGLAKWELSEKIGVKNAYRGAKTRPSPKTITRICHEFGVSSEWLATNHLDEIMDDSALSVSEKENQFDLAGGWHPQNVEKLTGFPAGHEMWQAYRLLSKIYESADQGIIESLYKVLEVFSQSVDPIESKKNNDND